MLMFDFWKQTKTLCLGNASLGVNQYQMWNLEEAGRCARSSFCSQRSRISLLLCRQPAFLLWSVEKEGWVRKNIRKSKRYVCKKKKGKEKPQRKSGWTESSCCRLTFEPPFFVPTRSHKTHSSIVSRMTVSTVSSCCNFCNFLIYGQPQENSG